MNHVLPSPGLRRLTGALVVLFALVANLVGIVSPASAAPVVSSVSLPGAFSFNQVFATGSQLVLTGDQYASRSPSVETCYQARVAPSSLTVSKVLFTSCDNPELDGASVAPYVSSFKIGYGELRVARLVPVTRAVELGPVLARFMYDSGTHTEWTYDQGSLWLYQAGTAQGARVFRVSATTGELLQSTPVPRFVRPLITANANGLYVAGAGSFGGAGRTLIYRVAPEAKAAQVVYTVGDAEDYFASWVTGDGDDLWSDICHRPVSRACEIWGFKGPSLEPLFHVSDNGRTGGWVLGDQATGLYSSISPSGILAPGAMTTSTQVIRIDPRSGRVGDVARLSLPTFWQGPDDVGDIDAVVYGGFLYVLAAGAGGAAGELLRVRI
jgi:hypothetical protein